MDKKEYFDITSEELQSLAAWAADCAARSLPIYETAEGQDDRPRLAIDGARDFARSGKRTNHLRKLAMDAYRASLETNDAAASAAGQSASLAAASAYTHPFRDVNQSKHILGPAAYSALAQELGGGEELGEREVQLAVATTTPEVARLLAEMPEQPPGAKRLEQLFHELDTGIRTRHNQQPAGGGR